MAAGIPNSQGDYIIKVLEGGAFGETVGKDAASLAGFHGHAVAKAAAIANPIDPATTQAAVISILAALKAKGIIS